MNIDELTCPFCGTQPESYTLSPGQGDYTVLRCPQCDGKCGVMEVRVSGHTLEQCVAAWESCSYTKSRELAARAEIVRDIIRAKKQLGYHGKNREKSFFKDIWPSILEHLQQTGYVPPR